jgi:hypothetical protein
MMMKMLAEGGVPVLIDEHNPSTELNPGGAFAYEPTKTMQADNSWVHLAEGKAVKVVAPLLSALPKDHDYKVLFMERDITEVAESTHKLIRGIHGDKVTPPSETTLVNMREGVKRWLSRQPNFEVLLVDYNKLIESTNHQEIADFIGMPLDINAVAKVPDKKHYRNRKVT